MQRSRPVRVRRHLVPEWMLQRHDMRPSRIAVGIPMRHRGKYMHDLLERRLRSDRRRLHLRRSDLSQWLLQRWPLRNVRRIRIAIRHVVWNGRRVLRRVRERTAVRRQRAVRVQRHLVSRRLLQ
jgi:hypothetical protein